MKRRINLICSLLALFCFISMYMPVVAPRYPAGEYYAPSGTYESEYFFAGEYYNAREYWDITRYVFSGNNIPARIVLSLTQALLLLWALMSIRGEAGRKGLIAAVANLVVVGGVLAKMMSSMWSCRWGVLAVIVLDAIAAVVMAANAE